MCQIEFKEKRIIKLLHKKKEEIWKNYIKIVGALSVSIEKKKTHMQSFQELHEIIDYVVDFLFFLFYFHSLYILLMFNSLFFFTHFDVIEVDFFLIQQYK